MLIKSSAISVRRGILNSIADLETAGEQAMQTLIFVYTARENDAALLAEDYLFFGG